MLLDIVILPPKSLREKIGKEIVRATYGLAKDYVTDNKKYIPHLSLFHLKTDNRGLGKVFAFVSKFVFGQRSFKVKNGRFGSPNGTGYLWYSFDLSPQLRKAQEVVRDYCGPLRTGVLPIRPLRPLSDFEKELRRKYGTSYLFERPGSTPHFSMTQLKSGEHARLVISKMRQQKINFLADTLAVGAVDMNGQVTKILKTFKLK